MSKRSKSDDPRRKKVKYAPSSDPFYPVEYEGLKLLRREGAAPGETGGEFDDVVRTMLFDRRTDAGEFVDLSADTEAVDRLLSVLADYLQRYPARTSAPGVAGEMDDQLLEQLRALGYVDETDG